MKSNKELLQILYRNKSLLREEVKNGNGICCVSVLLFKTDVISVKECQHLYALLKKYIIRSPKWYHILFADSRRIADLPEGNGLWWHKKDYISRVLYIEYLIEKIK